MCIAKGLIRRRSLKTTASVPLLFFDPTTKQQKNRQSLSAVVYFPNTGCYYLGKMNRQLFRIWLIGNLLTSPVMSKSGFCNSFRDFLPFMALKMCHWADKSHRSKKKCHSAVATFVAVFGVFGVSKAVIEASTSYFTGLSDQLLQNSLEWLSDRKRKSVFGFPQIRCQVLSLWLATRLADFGRFRLEAKFMSPNSPVLP